MNRVNRQQIWTYALGERLPRLGVFWSVVGIVGLASLAFVLGMGVGLYQFTGWLVIALVIGIVGGAVHAGLVPTVVSLWLIALWGHVFPPLVGYLTGAWSEAGRYTYPRLQGYAEPSAQAELLGGLTASLNTGLALAVVVGMGTYVTGSIVGIVTTKIQTS